MSSRFVTIWNLTGRSFFRAVSVPPKSPGVPLSFWHADFHRDNKLRSNSKLRSFLIASRGTLHTHLIFSTEGMKKVSPQIFQKMKAHKRKFSRVSPNQIHNHRNQHKSPPILEYVCCHFWRHVRVDKNLTPWRDCCPQRPSLRVIVFVLRPPGVKFAWETLGDEMNSCAMYLEKGITSFFNQNLIQTWILNGKFSVSKWQRYSRGKCDTKEWPFS